VVHLGMRTRSTGGARHAQGLQAKLICQSVREAQDNPLGSRVLRRNTLSQSSACSLGK
jgi:hypothetical protein